MVFVTVSKAVFGRNIKGAMSFFEKKIGGGGGDFFGKIKG